MIEVGADVGGTEDIKSPEDTERVDKWIENLVKNKFQRLATPPDMEGRSFVLTCRYKPAQSLTRESRRERAFMESHWEHVNEQIVIDLFEEIVEGSKLQYIPIGNRDYKIIRGDGWAVANGNKGARYQVNQPWPVDNPTDEKKVLSYDPFKLSDELLGLYGIEVLGDKVTDREKIYLGELGLLSKREGKSWRGLGFGKLLAATGLGVLKQIGVTEINFHGAMKDESQPIMEELGYNPKIDKSILPHERNNIILGPSYFEPHRQLIEDFSKPKIAEFITPFIKTS